MRLGSIYHIKSPVVCTCPCIADHLRNTTKSLYPDTGPYTLQSGNPVGQNRGFSSPVSCWEGKVRSSCGLVFHCIIFAIADARVSLAFPRFLELLKGHNRTLVCVKNIFVMPSYNNSGPYVFCLHWIE